MKCRSKSLCPSIKLTAMNKRTSKHDGNGTGGGAQDALLGDDALDFATLDALRGEDDGYDGRSIIPVRCADPRGGMRIQSDAARAADVAAHAGPSSPSSCAALRGEGRGRGQHGGDAPPPRCRKGSGRRRQ